MKKIVFGLLFVLSSCTVPVPLQKNDAGQSLKEIEQKEKTCNELRTMLCAKVSTCSNIDYNDCIEEFDPLERCDDQDILAVDICKQDMRNMKCTNNLPESCLKLN